MDVWGVELIVAREGLLTGSEQRAIRREVERGTHLRLRLGVYLPAAALQDATAEERHLLALRAFAAVAPEPPVFSHWSAAVLHGFATLGDHLGRVHATVSAHGRRGQQGVAGHVHGIEDQEVQTLHGLLVTTAGRTVVDVAGAGTFEEGVVTADSALAAGVPRWMLEQAVDLAGPRRSDRAIRQVVDFADPGGKSAGESLSRCTMHRLRVEKPVLQHRVRDHLGVVGDLDFFFPSARAGGEFDGKVKYLDPKYAPQGAGRVVYAEKVREDRLRSRVSGLARWGWEQARNPRLLAPVLAAAGVHGPER